jgi:hypothetical protein
MSPSRAPSPGAAAALLVILCACGSSSPRLTASEPPKANAPPSKAADVRTDEKITPDEARIHAAFQKPLKEYIALHRKLEASLPKLPKEATPQQIDKNQRALGALIKSARRGAKRGDLFSKDMEALVKKILGKVFTGREGEVLKAAIMDENPDIPRVVVNERYPDKVPLSTMPAEVLDRLPKLEEDVEYRFVGDRLVLLDTHAHIIVDYIDNVLPK